jgi:hypothetical protein
MYVILKHIRSKFISIQLTKLVYISRHWQRSLMIPSAAPFTFVCQVTKKLSALISSVQQLLNHDATLVKNGR